MKRHRATSKAVKAVHRCLRAVLCRILDGAEDARYRDTQREIERLIGRSGGHLTDEIERDISLYLMRKSSF